MTHLVTLTGLFPSIYLNRWGMFCDRLRKTSSVLNVSNGKKRNRRLTSLFTVLVSVLPPKSQFNKSLVIATGKKETVEENSSPEPVQLTGKSIFLSNHINGVDAPADEMTMRSPKGTHMRDIKYPLEFNAHI